MVIKKSLDVALASCEASGLHSRKRETSPFLAARESDVQQPKSARSDDSLELVPNDISTVEQMATRRGRCQAKDLSVTRSRSVYERRFKRSFDVVVGTGVAIGFAPLTLAIAAAVRIGLGRPVFYEQERIGENGERFTIYKFRTMRPDRRHEVIDLRDGADRRTGHKSSDDPRHTGLGRRLRQLSLDELPQIRNVLRGDMSLVGPRPEIPEVAIDGGYDDHIRHDVKPGMTGPYQTSDARLNGDLRDGLDLDTEYVHNLTLKNDLRYLVRTVSVMFSGRSGS